MADKEKSNDGMSLTQKIALASSILGLVTALGWIDQVRPFLPFHKPASMTSQPTPVTPYPPVKPTPTAAPTPDPETVRWDYIRRADQACAPATRNAPGVISSITYDWMMQSLTARSQMLNDWQQVYIMPHDPVNLDRLSKIWSDFRDANWHWEYMANSLRVNNKAFFNMELDSYRKEMDSFIEGANRYGFSVCNSTWNTVTGFR